jgi:hypothetical protein
MHKIAVVATLVLATGAVGSTHTGASSTPAASCLPSWRLVKTPRVGIGEFTAAAATSPKDAWVVGDSFGGDFALIEHWNGSGWNVAWNPDFALGGLKDVAATSATDAWAVGGGDSTSLVGHWDGRRWTRVPIQGAKTPLYGVTALSAHDVWAVGDGVIMHWDGARWKRVASPRDATLNDVAAISSSDVWAVGTQNDGLFTMHWDGHRWHSFPGPNVGDQTSWLTGVAVVSTNNVWAVGESQSGLSIRGPVVYHWNGRHWKAAEEPSGGPINGIMARSATDIWAVAWDDPLLGGGGTTIDRWNGKSWHVGVNVRFRYLAAIASDKRPNGLWAVGSTGDPNGYLPRVKPLVQRYGC